MAAVVEPLVATLNFTPRAAGDVGDDGTTATQFTLEAVASGGVGPYSYGWDFDGDGTVDATTAEASATHTYPAAGAYVASVTVTDAAGSTVAAKPKNGAGTDEAIITGEATLKGRRIAVVAGEFRFLAGSIGVVAAERIVLAFERAQREGLPVFAAPSSGGTRMQEGTPAFVTMVKISAAVAAFKAMAARTSSASAWPSATAS